MPTVSQGSVTAALIPRPSAVEAVPFPIRPVERGQVRVEIILCAICVTEVRAFHGGTGHGPSLCGHEWVGRVVETGEAVTSVSIGDRVVVAVPDPCGECPRCEAGETGACAVVLSVARGRDALAPPHGAFARSLTVAEYRVLPIPDVVSDVAAALVEPAAVAYRGVVKAGPVAGKVVVVLGAGPIGLLSLQMAKVAGAAAVVVVEPLARRRNLAVALGAQTAVADLEAARSAVDGESAGRGTDVVIECVGDGLAVQQAVDLVRPGGRVVLLGDAGAATISPRLWLAKEVTVTASAGYSRDDIRTVVRLIESGQVDPEPLHTTTIGLDGIADALGALGSAQPGDVKVVVDPAF